MLNKTENKYVELYEKAVHAPPSNEVTNGLSKLGKELKLKECGTCGGFGGYQGKGIAGGTEQGECKECNGLGLVGYSEELNKELLRV